MYAFSVACAYPCLAAFDEYKYIIIMYGLRFSGYYNVWDYYQHYTYYGINISDNSYYDNMCLCILHD